MTTPRRLAAPSLLRILATTIAAMLVVGCGGSSPTTAASHPAASPSATASSRPALTPVPGGASASARPAASRPATTDVEGFGRILDSLPPSFPKLAGQEPAETGEGPSSGSFTANVDVASASASILSALRAKGWTVEAGSPLEDGAVVLEASRPGGCKAEIDFTPRSGSVIMSVLYGASCPYP